MRGIKVEQFGDNSSMRICDDLPFPVIKNDEILIKIIAAGINPVDIYIREGWFDNLPLLPYIPGKDGAGIVEKVGDEVNLFKVGDRVFCVLKNTNGTYAEYVSVNYREVFILPEYLSFQQGAAIGIPYFTATRALFPKDPLPQDCSVFIHGASGGVGVACVQLAKAFGYYVTGTAGTLEGMKLVKDVGADAVFNHRNKKYVEKVKEACGLGFDLILEMKASANLSTDLNLLKHSGRIMIIGSSGDVMIDSSLIIAKEAQIAGVACLSASDAEMASAYQTIEKCFKERIIKPYINADYSLKDVQKAHLDLTHSHGSMGKLILSIG